MGTDRKSIMAVEPGSFQQTATAMPRLLAGAGLSALAANRAAVIVNSEIADGFSVKPATPSP
jgi:putative ABC transport system permease protein